MSKEELLDKLCFLLAEAEDRDYLIGMQEDDIVLFDSGTPFLIRVLEGKWVQDA